MMWTKVLLILGLVLSVTSRQGTPPKFGLTAIDALRQEFLVLQETFWDNVYQEKPNTITSSDEGGADRNLIKDFQKFGNKMDKYFPRSKSDDFDVLQSLWVWARISAEMIGIDGLYDSFRRFQRSQNGEWQSRQAGIDLAETILKDPVAAVPLSSARIHQLIVSNQLFEAALKESTEGVCSLRQSPQQVLYQLYSAVSLTELRGYSMIQFSWMLLKLYNKGNFTQEAYLMRKRYEERTAATAEAVRNAMVVASRDVWKCDPSHHKEGETFIALTRLLQGYVENEVNLNNINTCKESCSFYKYTNSSSGCYNGHCSSEQRCNGHLLQCQYIDSDMWVCPSDYKKTDRRYEWIEYENGRTLGQKGACSKGTTKVDSWWRWLFWHCSYCLCVCDEQSPKSDRFFNLRESISNISSNMVITGLRFVKANRIVHLQIQEGQLMPHGNINTTTTKWRPIDMYKLGDPHVQSGKDYHTLTWSNRSIDLDDLLVPDGHVVTGVRFRMVGTHTNMEVRASPINFTEGIVLEPTHWVSNDNTDASVSLPRTRLSLTQPDIPTRTRAPSIIDSKSDQFIEFTHSDIDKDAAQTTVPYLDAQDCSPNPPLPLGGAGLYHKGRNGFGGFVAPKVITYDFSKHVYVEFPLIEDAVN